MDTTAPYIHRNYYHSPSHENVIMIIELMDEWDDPLGAAMNIEEIIKNNHFSNDYFAWACVDQRDIGGHPLTYAKINARQHGNTVKYTIRMRQQGEQEDQKQYSFNIE